MAIWAGKQKTTSQQRLMKDWIMTLCVLSGSIPLACFVLGFLCTTLLTCTLPFLSVFLSLLLALSFLLRSLSLDRDRRPSSPGVANSRTLSRSHSRSPRARSRRCISLSRSAHRSRTPPTPRSRSRSLSLSLSLSRSLSLSLSRSGMRGGSRVWGPTGWATCSFSFSGFGTPLWKSSWMKNKTKH